MPRILQGSPGLEGLRLTALRDVGALEPLRAEWDSLISRSRGTHPFLSPTWALAWWRVFGPLDGRRPYVLTVRRGGELVGLFPLLERIHWYGRLLPMRRIEPMASGENQADEVASDYLGPLAHHGLEDQVAQAIAEHLTARRMTWHELVLPALDDSSTTVQALAAALQVPGVASSIQDAGRCEFVKLPECWEDYLAALSTSHRAMAKKSLRDFERWAGSTMRVEAVRGREDLERGRAILLALHAERWRASGRDGVFASPLFRRFHDLVMPELLERGELDLRWLVAHGRPVAVSYGIVSDNRYFFYQGGRAIDVPKGIRPGIVLHLLNLRGSIDSGRREYDFLGGDARYKRELSTGSRPLSTLRVTRASLPERARRGAMALRATLAGVRAMIRSRRRPAGDSP